MGLPEAGIFQNVRVVVVLFDFRQKESLDAALQRRDQWAALIAPNRPFSSPLDSTLMSARLRKKLHKFDGGAFLCPPLCLCSDPTNDLADVEGAVRKAVCAVNPSPAPSNEAPQKDCVVV